MCLESRFKPYMCKYINIYYYIYYWVKTIFKTITIQITGSDYLRVIWKFPDCSKTHSVKKCLTHTYLYVSCFRTPGLHLVK